MENKQFSTKNPLRILYLVDQSGSTSEKAYDKTRICEHFAEVTNNDIKLFISQNTDGFNPVKDKVIVCVTSFSGDGIEVICDGPLSSLDNDDSFNTEYRQEVINGDMDLVPHKIFITPKATGSSPLGRALKLSYNRYESTNTFPHVIIIVSDALVCDLTNENDNDVEIAKEHAELFKKKGTRICFFHITSLKNANSLNPSYFSSVNNAPDSTSRLAAELASPMDKSDRADAIKAFGKYLPSDVVRQLNEESFNDDDAPRWCATNCKGIIFNLLIQFGSMSQTDNFKLPPKDYKKPTNYLPVHDEEVIEDIV